MEEEITVNDVVLPDDLIAELRAIVDGEDSGRWEMGRITMDLVDEFGDVYGKTLVRKRVAIEAGVGVVTVRQREEMARFYPPEVVEEYRALTWSQLRACKPAGPIGWRELANWALESADDFGGRPAPVDAIIAKRMGNKERGAQEWDRLFKRMYEMAEDLERMPGVPRAVKNASETFREATDRWYRQLTAPAQRTADKEE